LRAHTGPLRHLDLGVARIGVQALAVLCVRCGAVEKLAADVVESGFVSAAMLHPC
jgi:hypothetical protein